MELRDPQFTKPMPGPGLGTLLLVLLLGCHQDQTVTIQLVSPAVTGTTVLTSGGSASSGGGATSPTGGPSGLIELRVRGSLAVGRATSLPQVPAVPPPPTTGTLVTSASFGNNQDVIVPTGNILIDEAVVTDVPAVLGAPRRIVATTGDLVLAGSLQSGQVAALSGGGQPITILANLSLEAPAGTVYVTGSVHTGSVDGLLTGKNAGNLSILANRIVVTGTLDTSGQTNASAHTGGSGGAVSFSLTPSGDAIYFTQGSITTSGAAGLGAGGAGGAVLFSAAPLGRIYLFGTLTTSGGPVNGTLPSAQGGAGGSVRLIAGGTVLFASPVQCQGGAATTSADGARGGSGGNLTIQNGGAPAPVLLFGGLDLRGGIATAGISTSIVAGGAGGAASIGQLGAELQSIQTGVSLIDSSGASADTGGAAGSMTFANADAGAEDAAVEGTLMAQGGPGVNGPGGPGGAITVSSASTGNLALSGSAISDGGSSQVVAGGLAGVVSVTTGGSISWSAQLSSSGGSGGTLGGGGAAGAVTFQSQGRLLLSGSIASNGGSSALGLSGPAPGGTVFVQSGPGIVPGSLFSTALITASGGDSLADPGTTVNGGSGGVVRLEGTNLASGITLAPGSTVEANGGISTGAGTGGTGGNVFLLTNTQLISVSGIVTALGGTAAGSGGIGGPGGLLVALSDNFNQPPGVPLGSVTLEVGSAVNVSGGAGFYGGNARSDGLSHSVAIPPATPYPSALLPRMGVLLMGEAVAGKSNAGAVVNNGTVTAAGGANDGFGGDVLFLGFGLGGAGAPLSGSINLAGDGTGSPGDFVGQN